MPAKNSKNKIELRLKPKEARAVNEYQYESSLPSIFIQTMSRDAIDITQH